MYWCKSCVILLKTYLLSASKEAVLSEKSAQPQAQQLRFSAHTSPSLCMLLLRIRISNVKVKPLIATSVIFYRPQVHTYQSFQKKPADHSELRSGSKIIIIRIKRRIPTHIFHSKWHFSDVNFNYKFNFKTSNNANLYRKQYVLYQSFNCYIS